MPVAAIKTAKDEKRWAECKKSVKKAHPDYTGDRFYAAVMGCVKKRKQNAGESFDESVFTKIMEEERGAMEKKTLSAITNVRQNDSRVRLGSVEAIPKLHGMPKWEVEEAVRVLERAEQLKNNPAKKKLYEAAMKEIEVKRKALENISKNS